MQKFCNRNDSSSTKHILLDAYLPLIGEFVWHSLTSDSTIESVGRQHFELVTEAIDRWATNKPSTILEVGAYAHATGYYLQKKYDAEVTLFDLSPATLRLGSEMIDEGGLKVDLVAGDFHKLPFVDGYFDVVYVFAALHHAADYLQVVKELQRVLTPNGLLFLFQEPIKRDACFYKFRTNRSYKYTNFEKALAEDGLLTTVAEPHPGSRDEILFGMIENQEIPLQVFVDSLTTDCDPLEIAPSYKGKIGELGLCWLKWGNESPSPYVLSQRISDDFRKRLSKLRPALDWVALGLGFSLPDENEIENLSGCIAKSIMALPSDSDSQEYHLQAACLFGGVLKFVGQKRRGATCHGTERINRNKYLAQYPVEFGIKMTFPETVRSVLNQSKSCIPRLDSSNEAELRDIFPENDWSFELQNNGFFALTLINEIGEINLPTAGEILFVLRINFLLPGVNEKTPYCFRLSNHSKEFYWQVFQEEAILYRETLGGNIQQKNTVWAKIEALENFPKPICNGVVKIYYAGVFPLRDKA